MRSKALCATLCALATLAAWSAVADWDPGQPYKMHFPQLPNPVGWDVRNTFNPEGPPPPIKILADDWQCTETGPVSDIHIWGSWRQDWPEHSIVRIHVEIWSDNPEPPYSRPAQRLWQSDFLAGQFVERFYGEGSQGWYDPNTGQFFPNDHFGIWQYNIVDIGDAFVQQQGTIYWLVVYFEVPDPSGESRYGWKTSLDHFQDIAVWSDDMVNWYPLMDPITGERLDLAFVITGGTHEQLDYGDAPDAVGGPWNYPTKLAVDGARHALAPGAILGATIDGEPDGQPTLPADGDDLNGAVPDDEDGVVFTSALIPGQLATVSVTVTGPCMLNGWVDFDRNGDWINPAEQVFTNLALPGAGNYVLPIPVPLFAVPGLTYARFRVDSAGGLSYTGFAPDGEVEDYQVQIEEEQEQLDFGDAPDQSVGPYLYPTVLAMNGARHLLTGGPILGATIDAEPNGQPTLLAVGDDLFGAIPDDEDGVVFASALIPGSAATISVTVTGLCRLNGWIDFDLNGDWVNPAEQVFTNQSLPGPGTYLLPIAVPAWALPGSTYARFRVDSVGGLSYTGYAADGEVEDYEVRIEEEQLDLGDAPDASVGAAYFYPTVLAADGARHILAAGPMLGAAIDGEPDGQPTLAADGDDLNGAVPDDEDGVLFTTPLVAGGMSGVTVTITSPGLCFLSAWIDYNRDGDWNEADEQVFVDVPFPGSVSGVVLGFQVPAGAVFGATYARFRVDSAGGLSYTGQAADGEVEDYRVAIDEEPPILDLGDLPDIPYPTLRANDGARHVMPMGLPVFLGANLDPEPDGQPTILADGDDLNGTPNDEDGVSIGLLIPGTMANVTVTTTLAGYLDAWVDWDQSGVLGDNPNEAIFASLPLVAGPNLLSFPVPAGLPNCVTYARFRYSSMGGLLPTGLAADGEVEDYLVQVGDVTEVADFGDAPDLPFPTLLPPGAYHLVDGVTYLGALVDLEADGQPDPNALGDDNVFLDDEDGVTFASTIVPAGSANVVVTASVPGILDAWMDFYANGDWTDPGENIFPSIPLGLGPNLLAFPVPADAVAGPAFARFRFSTMGGLPFTGWARDGEVEDYLVNVEEAYLDFGDAPDAPGGAVGGNPYPTLLEHDGARHVLPPGAPTYYLGALVDSDPDGQPDSAATGDDLAVSDDEDGVTFRGWMILGSTFPVEVVASAAGYLNAWVDFNGDGDWNDTGEQVFTDEMLTAGTNTVTFTVPTGTDIPLTYARFRFTSYPGVTSSLGPDGLATDGEVEDYRLEGTPIFADGFETGDSTAWSVTQQ